MIQNNGRTERRYYLWNIGCQMNRADAQRVSEVLEQRGYVPTRDPREARVILLNTCVVRQSAEDRVIGRLASLRPVREDDPRRALLVMGCFVGDDLPALEAAYPYVDGFFRPSDVPGVTAFVEEWEQRQGLDCDGECGTVSSTPVSALVPISYGCDHHCTYCIVTIRRGEQRSRPVADIVADAEKMVARGAREIVLLGQNVDAYGLDVPGGPDLADVLAAVHEIDGLWRIRFLTSHPKEMSPRIIEAVATLLKVCESWELPVQSGDDAVLRRMGRGYTVDHFRDLVGRIRRATPQGSINTDVIVGFSGETEAQFENTLALVEELRFDAVHIAAYSVRPGTPAARWEDDVPAEEKERRRALIEETQTRIAGELNAPLLGQTLEVLVDGRQRGRWRGRTRANKLVFFESDAEWTGRLARVRITWTGPWSMIGEVVA
ncbi:MAG: tRNA (N6-isopentenyl adenosine(37)-C2)-methylthiotransferase MiaB [Anaerolineae bacterium]|jgi:tRNA-2-methylthio-N6-dimethylallyladenosine synthase